SEHPGVVVTHDFFLSGVKAHMEVNLGIKNEWTSELYFSHGYYALIERENCKDLHDVILKYPCNSELISNSLGIIAHSNYCFRLAKTWYENIDESNWEIIPLLREPVNVTEDEKRIA